MKVVESYPPNYNEIVQALGRSDDAIYCYGDTIYNPNKREITPDIEVHEAVHARQQGYHPDAWYIRYLHDKEFRLQQEIEAYGEQYAFILPHVHGKLREWAKDNMARALSGGDYGNIISYREAEQAIRQYANNKQL